MFKKANRRNFLRRVGVGATGATALGVAHGAVGALSRRRAARARALTIGVNSVDPEHYAGWPGTLVACEFDAEDVAEIAADAGFEVKTLKTKQATAKTVLDELRAAANALGAGDIMLVHYSGHGGQLPDSNGDEDDSQDETWCLYDRQLVDDELYKALAAFNAGVRVLVLSDSCHSGTATKELQKKKEYGSVILAGGTNESDLGTRGMIQARVATGTGPAVDPNVPAQAGPAASIFRNMPTSIELPGLQIPNLPGLVYRKNKKKYDPLLDAMNAGDRQDVPASVLLISGCQDNQLSLDGQLNGLFTGRLKKVWNKGHFTGDHRDFHRTILNGMPSTQSPNYFWVGVPFPKYEKQKPFTIAAPA